MKKIFNYSLVTMLLFAAFSCNSTTTIEEVPVIEQSVQHTIDNDAAQLYLNTHYFDAKGNPKEFSDTDTSDDNFPKLINLNPVTLPSGVIYIKRSSPTSGQAILANDSLHFQAKITSYYAVKTDNVSKYGSELTFINTIATTGVPVKDPAFYHVKQSILNAYPTFPRSYYELEGFQEAIKAMNSYEINNEVNYNFQGLILIPSRAAFGRDAHFDYIGYDLKNRCFVASVQVYRRFLRP